MDSPVIVRLASGGRLEVLASSTDIGQGTQTVLAQIERGDGNPRLSTLRAIGAAFGLDVGFVWREP